MNVGLKSFNLIGSTFCANFSVCSSGLGPILVGFLSHFVQKLVYSALHYTHNTVHDTLVNIKNIILILLV